MTVVVVGAGLAGLRAAEAVRGHGLAVTVLGDERHLPYNRPPLSKAALRESATAADLAFRIRRDDLGWRLGQPVVGLDLYRREVLLADDTVPFDALIIATGIRPRVLPVPGPPPMVLRTVEDAEALRRALTPDVGCSSSARGSSAVRWRRQPAPWAARLPSVPPTLSR